jgi:alkylated DNA repair dioxygenase AlkB
MEIVSTEGFDVENGWYIWEPNFFNSIQANELFQALISDLPWEGGEIKLFGKTHQIPRKQVLFADDGFNYGYSGKKLTVTNWNETVAHVKQKIESMSDFDFNACLANLYRDGKDSNGWHADDEKELGEFPKIASVSFGASRKFKMRRKDNHKEKFEIVLNHGSLLLMLGKTQAYWQHQIPKTRKIISERINLTFRIIE